MTTMDFSLFGGGIDVLPELDNKDSRKLSIYSFIDKRYFRKNHLIYLLFLLF